MATVGNLDKIKKIINCMEMGVPHLKYDDITLLHDGPNKIKQITLSVGFTQFGGNLKKVLDLYIKKEGVYADKIKPYMENLERLNSGLADNKAFIDLLKLSAKEDQLMKDAQDEIYARVYLTPAMNWADSRGFTYPLSYLVIIDSFLQSGQVFSFLRNRFSEKAPVDGGDEKDWITLYVETRHDWMKNHTNKAVRNSTYRTKDYLRYISQNNWKLNDTVTANGIKI